MEFDIKNDSMLKKKSGKRQIIERIITSEQRKPTSAGEYWKRT